MAVTNIDNKLIPLAKRYSDALSQVAKERNELDAVYEDLKTVTESLNAVGVMKNFLSHPVIPFNEKEDLINAVFQGRIKECSLNLLFILLEKNKINLIDTIQYCYEESMDDAQNVLKIGVVSAVEVDEDLKAKLKEKLEKKLQKNVKFDFEINPDIIAGLVLKIQDKIVDGSMAAKLQGFKKSVR